MAKPLTAPWSKLFISVGDGQSPETFTRQCGFTSKGISFTSDVSDVPVPDCDDPDAPAWAERVVATKSATVSGEGILATDHLADWNEWFASGEARNCRIEIMIAAAAGGGYWTGLFVLTTFTVTGNQDDAKLTIEIELQSDGPVIWVGPGAIIEAATLTTPLGGDPSKLDDNDLATLTTTDPIGDLSAAAIADRIIVQAALGAAIEIGSVEAARASVNISNKRAAFYTSNDGAAWTPYGTEFVISTVAGTKARAGVVTANFVALIANAQNYANNAVTLADFNIYAPNEDVIFEATALAA